MLHSYLQRHLFQRDLELIVPRAGFEPARILNIRGILSPLRLPIPPPRHCLFEAAIGVEPMNRGFADLRLSHLATPPQINERETRLELATPTLARWCSTTELLPLKICENIMINYLLCKTFFKKFEFFIAQFAHFNC